MTRPPRYMPPSFDVIEHFASAVCYDLGPGFVDREVREGFTAFLKAVSRSYANSLNRKASADFNLRVE